jgi:hypothetical protein
MKAFVRSFGLSRRRKITLRSALSGMMACALLIRQGDELEAKPALAVPVSLMFFAIHTRQEFSRWSASKFDRSLSKADAMLMPGATWVNNVMRPLIPLTLKH